MVPLGLINEGVKQKIELNVTQLWTPKKNNENTIPFINTHRPGISNIFHTIRTYLPVLLQSPKMKAIIENALIGIPNANQRFTRTELNSESEPERKRMRSDEMENM